MPQVTTNFVLVLALCTLVIAQTNFIQINNDTLQFVDSYGRTRLFHGVNAVYKIPPWMPELETFNINTSLVAEDMQNLQNWGFNAIRLGVMWPGVSVSRSSFNQTYLSVMNDLITQLGSYGIYTIVDCHQDVFSRYFCGEGVPDWAVPQHPILQFPEPVAKPDSYQFDPTTGYPNITDCLNLSFFKYYFTGAVGNGFQHLYDNTNGLQDHFVAFWQQVATAFKNNPYVLGYELINEPWCGDIYKEPRAIFPEFADKNFLFPMYQILNNAIRSIDNDHIIFFEAAVSDITPCGFTEGPGGPTYNDRQAYSYHVYCAPTDSDGDPTKPLFCNTSLDITFDIKQRDRKNIGVAGFMTEFGAMRGTPTGVEALNYLMDKADSEIQSWTYWQFKFYEDITTASQDGAESFYVNGALDTNKVAALSRTYAPIIAGFPTVHTFNPDTKVFNLQFSTDMTLANLQTVIYYNPQYSYPNGVNVSVSSAVVVQQVTSTSITLTNVAAGTATVTVTAK